MNLTKTEEESRLLREYITDLGADLVGFAELELLREICTYPHDLFVPFRFAISIALRLSEAIIEGIKDRPTEIYAHHYRVVNSELDRIAFKVTQYIQTKGFKALGIPASQIVENAKTPKGHISHIAIALAAGLGWVGKNSLLITPQYGPRIRLVSVLTDLALTCGKPMESQCKECLECVNACPAGAIREREIKDFPPERESFLDFHKCIGKLREFSRLPYIRNLICGICIRACPVGRGLGG